MNFLKGKKTYLTAGVYGLCVVAEMLGINVPGFEAGDSWLQNLLGIFGVTALRMGISGK